MGKRLGTWADGHMGTWVGVWLWGMARSAGRWALGAGFWGFLWGSFFENTDLHGFGHGISRSGPTVLCVLFRGFRNQTIRILNHVPILPYSYQPNIFCLLNCLYQSESSAAGVSKTAILFIGFLWRLWNLELSKIPCTHLFHRIKLNTTLSELMIKRLFFNGSTIWTYSIAGSESTDLSTM